MMPPASGHVALSHSRSMQHHRRPGAETPPWVAIMFTIILFFWMGFAYGVMCGEGYSPACAAIHTITPESVSAQEISRAYGWRGDWRDYMEQMRRLNGWDSWPLLHAGEKIIVPDYRPDGRPATRKEGGRAGNGGHAPQAKVLLDRDGPPAH